MSDLPTLVQVPGYSSRQMAAIVLNEARRMQREGLLR